MKQSILVESSCGPDRYTGFFEQTDGTDAGTPVGGYLYISDCGKDEIVGAIEVCPTPLDLTEDDVRVLWSTDGTKCGVEIWGRMRGIINVATGDQVHTEIKGSHSPAVTDPEWLRGFDSYLDQHQFIRARQQFWKTEYQHHESGGQLRRERDTALRTNFIVYERGPDDLFAVFEDDGQSGYLYLYDSKTGDIAEYLHNYDRSENLQVCPEDVEVIWSEGGRKCGVIIWGKMRGIIDRQERLPGRVWMENSDSPGIADKEWLRGFEYYGS
jgi:hypothetical protein